jgi:hypothetical protein
VHRHGTSMPVVDGEGAPKKMVMAGMDLYMQLNSR